MQPLLLDGKSLAKKIEEDLKKRVDIIKQKSGKIPILATILVGNEPSSVTYVRMKSNACERIGMQSLKINLPENSTTKDLISTINELNENNDVRGILLQHPVPKHIDETACFNQISLEKDVDGVTSLGFGKMALKEKAFGSATPTGIMTLLKHYKIDIEGKEAVVVGRSPILGKPIAMMLLNENATVTICHSKTRNLSEVVKRGDIVVGAVGKPKYIKADWIKNKAILIDAGYNPGNIGDIDLENAIPICSAYTPVPGGVGPMTISSLIMQTVESAEIYYKI